MADLTSLFHPSSIAVIGASDTPGKIGHAIMQNLINSGYTGKIYPVNPKKKEIAGRQCFPKVNAAGVNPETAIIAVPAPQVIEVAEECGQTGVRFLIVISAGFKEVGTEGLARERKLQEICRQFGMRMVGPNCVGIMDTHTPMNASFARGFPSKGKIAFISQSGAILVSILDWSQAMGLGFSKFISLGNKGDLTETDFIENVAADSQTNVILCYIEDVENGRQFLKVARRASRKKPIIILKSGTSQAGAQAATSHTGALAGSDVAYETAFRQAGILRAHTMADLFDLAIAFARQPLPSGDRVAVITNSGGPGIIATDVIEEKGLKMARFSRETIDKLRRELPPESNIYNPVDIMGDAGVGRYTEAMKKVLTDSEVNSALVLLSPTAVADPNDTARLVARMSHKYRSKPIFAVYMGGESLQEGTEILKESGVPVFPFPEPAVSALAGMVNYNRTRQILREEKALEYKNVDQKTVKAVLYDVLRQNRLVLLGSEASEVLASYGISVPPSRLVTTAKEAEEAAESLGYPVALKVASPRIQHKTDVGGVKTGLSNSAEIRQAFMEILNNVQRYFPQTPIDGIEVQKMMPPGTELIIGMTKDIQFGPLIAFGMGGVYVNLLKDAAFRLAYGLTPQEIRDMIAETKAYTMLRGFRGSKPADIDSLVDIIGRLSCFCLDFPEVTEVDINPVLAYPDGSAAIDIKITLEHKVASK